MQSLTITPAEHAAICACLTLIDNRCSQLSYRSRDHVSPIPQCTADIGDMIVTIRDILHLQTKSPLQNSPCATSEPLADTTMELDFLRA